jgi:hypothetical protein
MQGLGLLVAALGMGASAQDALPPKGPQAGEKLTQRWQVGVEITAVAPCGGVLATAPVPGDWPEQTVKLVDRDLSPSVQLGQRVLKGGVTQMLVSIPRLNAGETAKALLTFEVTRSALLAPSDPSVFRIAKNPPRDLRIYLSESPSIESRHSKIRRLATELTRDEKPAWETVETIYDWVREHVEYKDGDLKGALQALEDGDGDCEELTSLFIALCRASKIPARTVWVPGHCYPEFYLEDEEGNGYWIPCQAAGTRDFGGMPDHRPILQKGDNFRVPEKKQPQRYVSEFLQVKSLSGAPPKVRFIRELLAAP